MPSIYPGRSNKIPETLTSKGRPELLYGFVDSTSVEESTDFPPFRWEYPEANISLNNCSLKQLLLVSSNLWHRSNVRLTNANAACLAILLLELLLPLVFGPRQVYQTENINQSVVLVLIKKLYINCKHKMLINDKKSI